MNYLAHIYLSGNEPLLQIGNFMADSVRGKSYTEMPELIQKGILLHREIDTFTDSHPLFRQGTKRLHPNYHHYAGVIMDLFYDHFLSKNWSRFSDVPLEDFIAQFYRDISANSEFLTDKVLEFYPIMIRYDWLGSYGSFDGLQRILAQMDHRTKNKSNMRFAIEDLQTDYLDYEVEFLEFFDELRKHCKQTLARLS